jgi:hypothetical protein
MVCPDRRRTDADPFNHLSAAVLSRHGTMTSPRDISGDQRLIVVPHDVASRQCQRRTASDIPMAATAPRTRIAWPPVRSAALCPRGVLLNSILLKISDHFRSPKLLLRADRAQPPPVARNTAPIEGQHVTEGSLQFRLGLGV